MKIVALFINLFLAGLVLGLVSVMLSGFAGSSTTVPIEKRCDSLLFDGANKRNPLKASFTVLDYGDRFTATLIVNGVTLDSPKLQPVKGGGMGGHIGDVMYFKDDNGYAVGTDGDLVIINNCSVGV